MLPDNPDEVRGVASRLERAGAGPVLRRDESHGTSLTAED